VFPANGTFTKRQKEVYETVLEVNKKAIEFLKPGMMLSEFNEYGKKLLTEGAKKLGLIKEDAEIMKYYYHSLGHYLGLDVHDVGNYAKPIPEGAVITVEPGLYIAEEGIGIRIEDDILVTSQGNINLSKDIIKEVQDIENFMK
jgi:Xaa-Pro aminopeptidase